MQVAVCATKLKVKSRARALMVEVLEMESAKITRKKQQQHHDSPSEHNRLHDSGHCTQ
jgi:hypothetical protein